MRIFAVGFSSLAGNLYKAPDIWSGTAVGAVTGGIAAELGGGKFRHGAYTSAFAYAASYGSNAIGNRRSSSAGNGMGGDSAGGEVTTHFGPGTTEENLLSARRALADLIGDSSTDQISLMEQISVVDSELSALRASNMSMDAVAAGAAGRSVDELRAGATAIISSTMGVGKSAGLGTRGFHYVITHPKTVGNVAGCIFSMCAQDLSTGTWSPDNSFGVLRRSLDQSKRIMELNRY